MNPKLLKVKKGPWREGQVDGRDHPVRTLIVDGWAIFEEVKWPIAGHGLVEEGYRGRMFSYEVAMKAKARTVALIKAELEKHGPEHTHDHYWDCDCESDCYGYITPKSTKTCKYCGAKFSEVDYADSTLSELIQAVTA